MCLIAVPPNKPNVTLNTTSNYISGIVITNNCSILEHEPLPGRFELALTSVLYGARSGDFQPRLDVHTRRSFYHHTRIKTCAVVASCIEREPPAANIVSPGCLRVCGGNRASRQTAAARVTLSV